MSDDGPNVVLQVLMRFQHLCQSVCCFLFADNHFQLVTEWLLMGRNVSAKSVPNLSLPAAQHPYRLSTVSALIIPVFPTPKINHFSLSSISFPLNSHLTDTKTIHPFVWWIQEQFHHVLSLHLTVLWSDCCGCGKEFKNEQSLVALDKHWHLGCFKCRVCNKVLNAEYISK